MGLRRHFRRLLGLRRSHPSKNSFPKMDYSRLSRPRLSFSHIIYGQICHVFSACHDPELRVGSRGVQNLAGRVGLGKEVFGNLTVGPGRARRCGFQIPRVGVGPSLSAPPRPDPTRPDPTRPDPTRWKRSLKKRESFLNPSLSLLSCLQVSILGEGWKGGDVHERGSDKGAGGQGLQRPASKEGES